MPRTTSAIRRHVRQIGSCLATVLVLVAAGPVYGQSEGPNTNGTGTQEISLEAGVNWVGLNVVPTSTSLADILVSILDDVVVVKDASGRHFVPGYGIDDIPAWKWNEGYLVNLQTPRTLIVEGEQIDAPTSVLHLESGLWNSVPYVGTHPVEPAQALAAINSVLIEARDQLGNSYKPGNASSDLALLQPGQFYQIRVLAPATLAFGGEGGGPTGPVVGTRADLLAMSTADLPIGHTVTVSGYYVPSDGGGGTFELMDAPEYVCDPGLVLCPEDQLGPLRTNSTTFSSGSNNRSFTVSHPPVAFGSLTMTLSALDAGGQPWELDVPDGYMHGTTYQMRADWTRSFRHETGRFQENHTPGWRPFNVLLESHLGADWTVDALFQYRQITGDRRWIRTHDAQGASLPPDQQIWDARWFGCRSHQNEPYFDNTNCINWAMTLARHTNQASPGRVAEVRLSKNGPSAATFYYLKSIQVPDGVALTGDAGARVVTATDEFGNVFHPVRPRPDGVTLRVLPESAEGCLSCSHVFDHIDMRRPYNDENHLPPSASVLLGNTATSIHPEDGAATWAVKGLILDGNKVNQDIRAARFSNEDRETFLRNSPAYSGIVQSNHGGKNVVGQRLTVERTYITGYAATGVITMLNADTTFFRDVSIGDAEWNHAAYLLGPVDGVNVGTHGQAWGHFEIYGGRIVNLVAENLAPGRSGANAVFSWRGGDYDRVDDCPPSRPCGTIVHGLYADMQNSGRIRATQGLGPGIHIRDVILVTPSDAYPTELWRESGNGYQSARYHDFRIENATYFVRPGGSAQHVIGSHHLDQSWFRNIQTAHEGDGSHEWGACFHFMSSSRGDGSVPPFEVIYDALGSQDEPLRCDRLARASFSSSSAVHRYYLLNSRIDNGDSGVIRGLSGSASGTGRVASICENDEPCERTKFAQVYLDDVQLRAHGNGGMDGELFFEVARFRNVTDPSTGATSEDSGSFTCNGSVSYTIPTNLYWRPHASRGRFDITGGPPISSINFVNQDGTAVGPSYIGAEARDARQPFAQVEFESPCSNGTVIEWDAAVSQWLDENMQAVSVPQWYNPE